MSIGEKIKQLRKNAEMTQEYLAELLNISPQAVSRWETDIAMPDISLLMPIANLFSVSTDFLLGMESYERDKRKAFFDDHYHEYWKKEKENNLKIAKDAVNKYPGEEKYQEWLASSLMYVAMTQKDENVYTTMLESAVRHYKIVLENSKNQELLTKARHGIVLSLHYLNQCDEAKIYALAEKDQHARDNMLSICLFGDEHILHKQKLSEKAFYNFLTNISVSSEKLKQYEFIQKLCELLFPDGNMLYFHNILQYVHLDEAKEYCKIREYDSAIKALKKSKLHAVKMDSLKFGETYTFTSPFFSKIIWVNDYESERESDNEHLDNFYEALKNNKCFDILRDKADFIEL